LTPSFQRMNCPCCSTATIREYATLPAVISRQKLDLPLFICELCSHGWLDTRGKHGLIEQEYDRDYAGHRIDPFFEQQCRDVVQAEIRSIIPSPAKVLDVGCGNGGFIIACQNAGYEATGVDISTEAVAIAIERGGKALAVDFLSYNFQQRFDIISMWDVIEHLSDPLIFLNRARELLNPGGALIIKTPAVGKRALALARLLPAKSGAILNTPHHVQFWTETSMTELLTRARFPIVTFWTPRRFRSASPTRSVALKSRRWILNQLLTFSGNSNIFCAART
jgi:2-polyprenyl-3-methyl-5-hydroxy-6-metoxy-1,4-benzoquinol methylase